VLPSKNRLKKKKDFERTFKKSKGIKNKLFVLLSSKNSDADSRFGFVVGQKVSKKAVKRNKIKRRMRSVVEQSLSIVKKGLDVIIIGLKPLEEADFSETKEALKDLLKKAKII